MIRHFCLCLLAAVSGSAFAVDGLPDSTFGILSSGKNFVSLNLGGSNNDSTVDVLVGTDRSIFIVGTARAFPGQSRFAITKLTPNGIIDPSFGSNGTVFSATANLEASRARLDAAGNIVVVGTADFGASNRDFYICRFTQQGLPAKFSALNNHCRSIAVDIVANGIDVASDFRIDAQGRITILGTAFIHSARSRVAMKRMLPDGQLDVLEPGLGANGGLYEYVDSTINRGAALAIQPDGKYIVVGEAGDPTSINGTSVLLARMTPNGTRDPSFQNGNTFAVFGVNQGSAFHRDDAARAVELLSDGSIMVAGTVDAGSGANQHHGFLFKFKPLDVATFDDGFGASGQFYYNGGYTTDFNRLLVQSDDKIVVAGSRNATNGSESLMHVIRLRPSAVLDASNFGAVGRVDVDFFLPGGGNYGTAITSQDGSLLIAGHSANQNAQDLDQTITRLHNDLIFADGVE
ncbi:MAG: delta-60 repeat domain-containing protein [Dokdonella sp.]